MHSVQQKIICATSFFGIVVAGFEPSCCGMFDDPRANSEPSCCGMFDDPRANSEPSCCGMFDDPRANSEPSCCGMFDDPRANSEPSCCGMFDDPRANLTQTKSIYSQNGTLIATSWQIFEAKRIASEILKLDVFDDMMIKLVHPIYGPDGGWTKEFSKRSIIEYSRFMALADVFGEAVPSFAIDEIWHNHIIDTRRYSIDCNKIFGRFLHHYPYFGLGGKHGEHIELLNKFKRTMKRYIAIFNDYPDDQVWGKNVNKNSNKEKEVKKEESFMIEKNDFLSKQSNLQNQIQEIEVNKPHLELKHMDMVGHSPLSV